MRLIILILLSFEIVFSSQMQLDIKTFDLRPLFYKDYNGLLKVNDIQNDQQMEIPVKSKITQDKKNYKNNVKFKEVAVTLYINDEKPTFYEYYSNNDELIETNEMGVVCKPKTRSFKIPNKASLGMKIDGDHMKCSDGSEYRNVWSLEKRSNNVLLKIYTYYIDGNHEYLGVIDYMYIDTITGHLKSIETDLIKY